VRSAPTETREGLAPLLAVGAPVSFLIPLAPTGGMAAGSVPAGDRAARRGTAASPRSDFFGEAGLVQAATRPGSSSRAPWRSAAGPHRFRLEHLLVSRRARPPSAEGIGVEREEPTGARPDRPHERKTSGDRGGSKHIHAAAFHDDTGPRSANHSARRERESISTPTHPCARRGSDEVNPAKTWRRTRWDRPETGIP